MTNTLKLTPITRLSMSFDHELDLDDGNEYTEKVQANYLLILAKSEKQRDDVLKLLVMLDAVLAVLLTGSKLSIPWIGLSTTELPAVLEIVTALSSVVYFFVALFFANALCYAMVVDQFKVRTARKAALDPDYLVASEKLFIFPIKMFRSKLNIWGADFYSPDWGFKALAIWIEFVTALVFIGFGVAHFCLFGYSAWTTLNKSGPALFQYIYVLITLILNLGGLSVFVFSNKDFSFKMLEASPPLTPSPTKSD